MSEPPYPQHPAGSDQPQWPTSPAPTSPAPPVPAQPNYPQPSYPPTAQPSYPQPGSGYPQPGFPHQGAAQPPQQWAAQPQPQPWPAQGYGPMLVADPADPLISPNFSGWWSRSVSYLKAFWRPLLILQMLGALVAVIVQLPALIGTFTSIGVQPPTVDATEITGGDLAAILGQVGPAFGVAFGGEILAYFASIWATVACILLVARTVSGGQPDVSDALRGSLRRVPPLAGWSLLVGLIILAGACACLLPAFYFFAVLGFVLPAVVLFERTNVIGRCFTLFHRDLGSSLARVGTMFAVYVAAWLIELVITAVVGAGLGAAGLSSDVLSAVSLVISPILGALVGVVIAPMTLTAYADMRARVEPLSTAVLVGELHRAG